jgi:hypothetical protein
MTGTMQTTTRSFAVRDLTRLLERKPEILQCEDGTTYKWGDGIVLDLDFDTGCLMLGICHDRTDNRLKMIVMGYAEMFNIPIEHLASDTWLN